MALMQAGPQLGQAPAYPAVGTGTGVHLALFFRLSSTLTTLPNYESSPIRAILSLLYSA